jgi:CBS domain-containing protein
MIETIDSILRTKGQVIWSIGLDTTVYDAIALMAEKGIGALLVISEDRLVGIVSERDYARKVILQGRSSKDTRAEEIMTRDLVSASYEDTVDECMRVMTHHRIRHLPVFRGEKLVGIVSIGDLVKAVIADQAHTIAQLHTYIGSKYPA